MNSDHIYIKMMKVNQYWFWSSTWFWAYSRSAWWSCPVCVLRDFAKTIKRPFSVYYNPYTQSVDLLKDTSSIEAVVLDLRSDLTTVCDALAKMNTYMGI